MSKRNSDEYKIHDAAEQLVAALPPLDRHPGLFIRDVLLPEWGLNISKLATLLTLNRANLSQVLSGQREVSRDLAYRLGALMNDEVADLLIAYQHAWNIDQERTRRAQIKAEISRLDPVEAA